MAELSKPRPKFLNLLEIRLPLPAKASILHRVSGVGLFLLLPLLICLLDMSLASPDSYRELQDLTAHPLVKLVLTGLLWAFLHHFCMGVRILLIDVHVGVEKAQANLSAKLVFAVSLALTALFGAMLW